MNSISIGFMMHKDFWRHRIEKVEYGWDGKVVEEALLRPYGKHKMTLVPPDDIVTEVRNYEDPFELAVLWVARMPAGSQRVEKFTRMRNKVVLFDSDLGGGRDIPLAGLYVALFKLLGWNIECSWHNELVNPLDAALWARFRSRVPDPWKAIAGELHSYDDVVHLLRNRRPWKTQVKSTMPFYREKQTWSGRPKPHKHPAAEWGVAQGGNAHPSDGELVWHDGDWMPLDEFLKIEAAVLGEGEE